MKFGKLILASMLFLGSFSIAQDEVERTECNRFKTIAGNAYNANDFSKAASNYLKAEKECGGLELAFYKPMIYALQTVVNGLEGEAQAAYVDTLLTVYSNAQEQHGEQMDWKTYEGYYYMLSNREDKVNKIVQLLGKGLYHDEEPTEAFVSQYYYYLYYKFTTTPEDQLFEAKKEMISEYFKLSELIAKNKMSPQTMETVTSYFDQAVTDCASILPEIASFTNTLPEDKDSKTSAVKNFMSLLENKGCTKSEEYGALVDIMIEMNPTSLDAKLAKAKYLMAQDNVTEAIGVFKEAKGLTEDAEKVSEIEYTIAKAYYDAGRYKAAHDAGLAVSGNFSKDGAKLAANAVIKLMDSCGDTTIDRKANALYAVQIANKYGFSASSYESQAPTSTDLFNAGMNKGTTVTLSCWGVSVTL